MLAILDLLFEAEMNKQRGLSPTEISKRVGTWLPGGKFKNAIVCGFLAMLEDRGLIESVEDGRWMLSEMERENRRED